MLEILCNEFEQVKGIVIIMLLESCQHGAIFLLHLEIGHFLSTRKNKISIIMTA